MAPLAPGLMEVFRRRVWAHYRKHGRHDLPWRKTTNVYKILVSEVMLQQTQVDRVVPFYRAFLKKFPTAQKLAAAPLAEVLGAWQGLGYNRRAKMLHAAAKAIGRGRMPRTTAGLEQLPGVGPYTARAVAAFAWNEDVVLVETNIRTAVIYHFFLRRKNVTDKDIEAVLARAMPYGKAREWYWALMDYGAHLKRSGIRVNNKSAHHTVQKSFKGSLREVRGQILKVLLKGSQTGTRLEKHFDSDRHQQVRQALDALVREGLIVQKRRTYQLAD